MTEVANNASGAHVFRCITHASVIKAILNNSIDKRMSAEQIVPVSSAGVQFNRYVGGCRYEGPLIHQDIFTVSICICISR